MNLLIKDVTEEQMKAIRVAAAQAGKTVKAYVLGLCAGEGCSLNSKSGVIESGSVEAAKVNRVRARHEKILKTVPTALRTMVGAASALPEKGVGDESEIGTQSGRISDVRGKAISRNRSRTKASRGHVGGSFREPKSDGIRGYEGSDERGEAPIRVPHGSSGCCPDCGGMSRADGGGNQKCMTKSCGKVFKA